MTTFTSQTPNLVVRDMAATTAFYRGVLGFAVKQTVPDDAPFVFVWLERDAVQVFLNDVRAVKTDVAAAVRNVGGSGVFIIVEGLDDLHDLVSKQTALVMPLTKQFYGMREFAVADPDGHVITFAERYTE